MKVHGSLHALFVEIRKKLFVVWEQTFIPVPARPSTASLGADGMPVHIYDEHVKRQVQLSEAGNEVAEILVAITPIAAPPITEGIAWGKGNLACELGV